MAKPTVLLKCVADQYSAPSERIVEFSDGLGKQGCGGGLISFRRLDGRFIVCLYNLDADVEVEVRGVRVCK